MTNIEVPDTKVRDTISRQAAIETAQQMLERCDTGDIIDYRDLVVESLKILPSAEPKKGKWIPINPGARIKHFFKCSLCGSSIDTFCISSDINYCPNCGHPMMRGEENDCK